MLPLSSCQIPWTPDKDLKSSAEDLTARTMGQRSDVVARDHQSNRCCDTEEHRPDLNNFMTILSPQARLSREVSVMLHPPRGAREGQLLPRRAQVMRQASSRKILGPHSVILGRGRGRNRQRLSPNVLALTPAAPATS
mmetsp:Transcript_129665/g.415905  ORF Transcript_129665/g.415905 Transcript_129665/m.415905 type:complete len:138 (+) Transcript_129665:1284-1697(+)